MLSQQKKTILNVLGEAELLEEAEAVIKNITMEETTIIWSSFFSTHRKKGNIEMTERVVKCLLKLDPDVHISNACYLCVFRRGSWTEGFHEGNTSEEGSTCSSMEVDYKVHEFIILFAGKDTLDSQNINNKFIVKYNLNLFQ